MSKYLILLLLLFCISCSQRVTLTLVEILHPIDNKYNMGHVVNDRVNYSEVQPVRNNLQEGQQFRATIKK